MCLSYNMCLSCAWPPLDLWRHTQLVGLAVHDSTHKRLEKVGVRGRDDIKEEAQRIVHHGPAPRRVLGQHCLVQIAYALPEGERARERAREGERERARESARERERGEREREGECVCVCVCVCVCGSIRRRSHSADARRCTACECARACAYAFGNKPVCPRPPLRNQYAYAQYVFYLAGGLGEVLIEQDIHNEYTDGHRCERHCYYQQHQPVIIRAPVCQIVIISSSSLLSSAAAVCQIVIISSISGVCV